MGDEPNGSADEPMVSPGVRSQISPALAGPSRNISTGQRSSSPQPGKQYPDGYIF